jgi:hypothetical protein
MSKLLGLAGHREAKWLTIEEFDKRQSHRNFVDQVLVDNIVFEYNHPHVRKRLQECTEIGELLDVLKLHLSWEKVNNLFAEEEFVNFKNEKLPLHEWSGKFQDKFLTLVVNKRVTNEKSMRVLEFVMYHLKELIQMQVVSMSLKGSTPCSVNPVQRMYIYTNIIEPMDMNNTAVKLLKLINTRGAAFKTTQEEFTQPMYLPVEKGKISMIEVLIADETGDPVPFQTGTVVLTLHFRKAQRLFRRLR